MSQILFKLARKFSRKAAKDAKEILSPGLKPMIWPFFASLAPLRETPFGFCLLVPACPG
jgi:hypothetical protein